MAQSPPAVHFQLLGAQSGATVPHFQPPVFGKLQGGTHPQLSPLKKKSLYLNFVLADRVYDRLKWFSLRVVEASPPLPSRNISTGIFLAHSAKAE